MWMKLAFVMTVALGCIWPGAAAPRAKDVPPPPDYYPTAVGTIWVYDMDNGNGEQVQRISAVEVQDGVTLASMSLRGTTGWFPLEKAAILASGVRIVEFGGDPIEPYYSLKYPVKAGDTWDFNVTLPRGLPSSSGTVTVLGEEEVKVPAGRYKAVKLERVTKTERGRPLDKPAKVTVWFAEGVGRVKVSDSRGCELALKSFTRGK